MLQTFYNDGIGLFDTTGWWNSANCITVLADLTAINADISIVTGRTFQSTFTKAQKFNLHQMRMPYCHDGKCAEEVQNVMVRKRGIYSVNGVQVEYADPKGFLNGFFDDESWWALAWMKVYDLTSDRQYLDAAEYIFQDLRTQATNATCGGVWWDRPRTANTAISNALYISVAAHLASRVPKRGDFYLKHAIDNWRWFEDSGLIDADNQINDGINLQTCKNDGKDVWSYNQGVILGALTEMNKLTSNVSYVDIASKIATAAVTKMVDANGIFHDPREPNLGGDGNQFKGVFARNLKELYKVTRNPAYKTFLEKNADSLWATARNSATGVIGGVWSGPYDEANGSAASQSSGMDALIAAAVVQK